MQVKIVSFKEEFSKDFYNLNVEWLKSYFYVEPFDEEILSKPQEYIIDKGGFIFFATYNSENVGTVALMPTKIETTFELTKMAVLPNLRGLNIGQKLMQHCIEFSKNQGFKELMLYSNTKLENAIYIYRKFGFIEIPVEHNSPYKRSNIKMIYEL